MLAGVNGAGKSTYYRDRLKSHGMPFLNADEIAVARGITDPQMARQLADELRDNLIASRQTFAYETVFSDASCLHALACARQQGYHIILTYIHLTDVALNNARIAQRVSAGGHHVPPEKVHARRPRVMEHMKSAVKLVDSVVLLDNSDDVVSFRVIAEVYDGVITPLVKPLPQWALEILF